jgi:hypothetical protein
LTSPTRGFGTVEVIAVLLLALFTAITVDAVAVV